MNKYENYENASKNNKENYVYVVVEGQDINKQLIDMKKKQKE
jgi:hypothetical protein